MPYININNINLYYEERGSGYPLILIMGLGADRTAWERHVIEFEKYFHCILIDNRGVGNSDKPKDSYDSLTMARDVLELMDVLKIEKAHVNGCSMGGMIAQELALHSPERISAIVFTASMAKLDTYGKRLIETFADAYEELCRLEFLKFVNLIIYSRKYHSEKITELLEEERKDLYNPEPMPSYAYRRQAEVCIKHDAIQRLHLIEVPCLVYAGESDLISSVSHAKWMADTLPDAKLEIVKGRGHVFHFEEVDKYNRTVVDFLKRVH